MRTIFIPVLLACLTSSRARAQEIPLASLDTISVRTGRDTILTYTQRVGGKIVRGRTLYLRVISGTRSDGWQHASFWRDSNANQSAIQVARTVRGSLVLREETVRARRDSATLIIVDGRASGWVVPQRGRPRLLSAIGVASQYPSLLVETAFAAAKPSVGSFVVAPVGSLYGTAPLVGVQDTIRVTGSDELQVGESRVQVWVLTRSNGEMAWADKWDGRILMRRGRAGPNAFWYHAVRGLNPESASQ